jgi:quercetin dioxygenase-like cupin family protein
MVTSEEFAFRGFRADADSNNPLGIGIIPGFAGVNYPALNTQSFALAKFNYAKGGLVPPHTHPRASEVITVTKGEVYVGFVDTAGKLYAVTLKKDDFFLFPQGLVHFQLNSGGGHAKTVSVLNAQNPGVQLMPSALFGSSPSIQSKILAQAFGISVSQVDMIKKGFQPA